MNIKLLLIACLYSLSIGQIAYADNIDKSLKHLKPVLTSEFKELLINADIKKGEAYFERKCSSCHTVEEGGAHDLGPALWGWLGRRSGSSAGFEYSNAMRSSGHTWDVASLNYYLTKTERAVPGRAMNFRGIRGDQPRAELIAYLLLFNNNSAKLNRD